MASTMDRSVVGGYPPLILQSPLIKSYTNNLVPSTWYHVLGAKYLVPIAGTKLLVSSTWYQV